MVLTLSQKYTEISYCIGCGWQGFGSGRTSGVAYAGRGRELAYAGHSWV